MHTCTAAATASCASGACVGALTAASPSPGAAPSVAIHTAVILSIRKLPERCALGGLVSLQRTATFAAKIEPRKPGGRPQRRDAGGEAHRAPRRLLFLFLYGNKCTCTALGGEQYVLDTTRQLTGLGFRATHSLSGRAPPAARPRCILPEQHAHRPLNTLWRDGLARWCSTRRLCPARLSAVDARPRSWLLVDPQLSR
jgi:hypothetical protein